MEVWILTMILTLGGGSSPRPAVSIHTQEYTSKTNCENASLDFLKRLKKPSNSMDIYEDAYCTKK